MCHVRVAEARDDMWDCRQDNERIKAGPQFVQGYERNSILKTKLSALIPADACWQICNCPIVHLEPGLCKAAAVAATVVTTAGTWDSRDTRHWLQSATRVHAALFVDKGKTCCHGCDRCLHTCFLVVLREW